MQSAPYAVVTNLILRHLSFLSFLDGKLDRKASEMVFWVCKQIESAVMRSKDVANEQKTETLTLGLGREKRSEEILRYSRRDAMTIVGDGERSWRGDFKGDKSLCRTDTLHSILDNVDKHLLEEDGVKMNGYGFVGKTEFDLDMSLGTQVFKEWTTGRTRIFPWLTSTDPHDCISKGKTSHPYILQTL